MYVVLAGCDFSGKRLELADVKIAHLDNFGQNPSRATGEHLGFHLIKLSLFHVNNSSSYSFRIKCTVIGGYPFCNCFGLCTKAPQPIDMRVGNVCNSLKHSDEGWELHGVVCQPEVPGNHTKSASLSGLKAAFQ